MEAAASTAEVGSTVVAGNFRSQRRDTNGRQRKLPAVFVFMQESRKAGTFSTLLGAGSRFSRVDISANHSDKLAREFERFFGLMARNKSSVVIECHVSLSPEPVEHGHQTGMFLVNSRPDEFDDGNVMARLAPGAEPVAEHEARAAFNIAS
jgi:hypothetical protein